MLMSASLEIIYRIILFLAIEQKSEDVDPLSLSISLSETHTDTHTQACAHVVVLLCQYRYEKVFLHYVLINIKVKEILLYLAK